MRKKDGKRTKINFVWDEPHATNQSLPLRVPYVMAEAGPTEHGMISGHHEHLFASRYFPVGSHCPQKIGKKNRSINGCLEKCYLRFAGRGRATSSRCCVRAGKKRLDDRERENREHRRMELTKTS